MAPELLWRNGELFELEPGVFKTISGIGYHGSNQEGSIRSVNDWGQFAVRLSFTDGTEAIVLTDATVVPEPTSIGLVLVAIAGATVRLRRRRV